MFFLEFFCANEWYCGGIVDVQYRWRIGASQISRLCFFIANI